MEPVDATFHHTLGRRGRKGRRGCSVVVGNSISTLLLPGKNVGQGKEGGGKKRSKK